MPKLRSLIPRVRGELFELPVADMDKSPLVVTFPAKAKLPASSHIGAPVDSFPGVTAPDTISADVIVPSGNHPGVNPLIDPSPLSVIDILNSFKRLSKRYR